MSEAGWVTASYEVMIMIAVNHEPMIRLEGTSPFKAVRMSDTLLFDFLIFICIFIV